MGRKTNPIILRLGVKTNYNYKYLEKKSPESAMYGFKNLEIYNFIYKFFKNNKLELHNCKISYSDNDTINIFISYYASVELNDLNVIENISEYKVYQSIQYLKVLNTKKNVLEDKNFKSILRNRYLKNFKLSITDFSIKNVKTAHDTIKKKFFLNTFLESLNKFINKNIKISLTLRQLNKNLKTLTKKETKLVKKDLIKLNRYEKNEFLKEGLNLIYMCCQQPNSSKLLAEFISNQLEKTKRHNFFLKFLKKCITIFKNKKKAKLKGIKIKIKGRINRAFRSKKRTIKIGNNLPVLSINSNINYAEKTAYTTNGTVGVKVWTF